MKSHSMLLALHLAQLTLGPPQPGSWHPGPCLGFFVRPQAPLLCRA